MSPAAAFAATSVEVNGQTYSAEAGDLATDHWHWDGGYGMQLNGYNGGTIKAQGDLTITYSGENVIDSNYKPSTTDEDYTEPVDGISTRADSETEEAGNLVIVEGEEGGTLEVNGEETGIYCEEGDLSIQGDGIAISSEQTGIQAGSVDITDSALSVAVNSDEDHEAMGIMSNGGPLTITNSVVRVTTDTDAKDAGSVGLYAAGDFEGAQLTIKDSRVDVSSNGGYAVGIMAASMGNSVVTFDNSTVNVDSSLYGVLAVSPVFEAEGYEPGEGSIVLNGSSIATPEGGVIFDTSFTLGEQGFVGKAIGAAGASTADDTASTVNIVRGDVTPQVTPAADTTPAAATTTQASNAATIAKTGDNTAGIVGGALAAAFAAISTAAAGAFALRRNQP